METDDLIREFLRERGSPDYVVNEGIHGLVARWERFAESLDGEYEFGLDDYLNDLDVRQIIEEVFVAIPGARSGEVLQRVGRADVAMTARTRQRGRCLWGEDEALDRGWLPSRNWWYYLVPRNPGTELMDELNGSQRPQVS